MIPSPIHRFDQRLKHLASMLKVSEHIKAGAGRRKQHIAAGGRHLGRLAAVSYTHLHYIDNGYGRDNYRAHHDPADRLRDFPGLNHLYLRFDWGDIEREEGVFDWSYIDAIMEDWSADDYRFAFRVCTYEGSAAVPSLLYATPKWVYEAGARYTRLSLIHI